MAKFKLFLAFLFLLALSCGCEKAEHTAPTLPPQEQYRQMAEQLCAQPMLRILCSQSITMNAGSNTYTYRLDQRVLLDTETGNYSAAGTYSYGNHEIKFEQLYQNEALYLSVNEGRFAGDYEETKKWLPQPDMFTDHTAAEQGGYREIGFNDPKGEFWTAAEGARVLSASGSLRGDEQMADLFTYCIEYVIEDVTFQVDMHMHLTPTQQSMPLPKASLYIPISDITVPLTLEKAYGLLCQSTHITSHLSQDIFSQANSLEYRNLLKMQRLDQSANIQTAITLTDTGRANEELSVKQTEEFENGRYTIGTDDTPPTDQNMDNKQFFSYFTQTLSKNILAARYVTQAASESTEDSLWITLATNEELAENVCQSICQTLYQNPMFLDEQSTDYDDYSLVYRICLDPVTGLPRTCDLDFDSSHTIAGIEYALRAQYRQTYTYQ